MILEPKSSLKEEILRYLPVIAPNMANRQWRSLSTTSSITEIRKSPNPSNMNRLSGAFNTMASIQLIGIHVWVGISKTAEDSVMKYF